MGYFKRLLGAAALAAVATLPAAAQQLTVWHDLGDNGIKWFDAMSAEFAKTKPGVTVKSLSFPTDQWFGRVIGALNTDTAPDLIFNNYERVIRIQDQTGKVSDLKDVLGKVGDRGFLSEDDLKVATYKGKQIIIPIQRVQMGLACARAGSTRSARNSPRPGTM